MALSPAFVQALTAGRPQFNARVAEARHRYPGLDNAAFGTFLTDHVDPLVVAVAAVAPDDVGRVVVTAYDVALDLVGQGLVGPGARSAFLNRIWSDVVPSYARLIAHDPLAVLGALVNAALNVEKIAGARAQAWLGSMRSAAPSIESIAHLHAVGIVAAWRSGLAHLRAGAIRAANELPEALALSLVGAATAGHWSGVHDRLLADPWWVPDEADDARLHRRSEIGAYIGLGGSFCVPPQVRATQDGFVVRSGERYGFLVADAFGAVLHPATADEFERADDKLSGPDRPRLRGNRIELDCGQVDLDLPAEGLALAANAHTVAVTSPYTHAIRLLPRR